MITVIQDLKYGVRMLLKDPGVTIIAVLTLALGIGVNSALFSVFDAFVLKPLPIKDPDSLVSFEGFNQRGDRQRLVSYLDYLTYRDRATTVFDVIAWNKLRATLGEAPPAQDDSSAFAENYEYLFGEIVSANYFSTLGASMSLGRGLQSDDEKTDGRPVVVLSYGCWQRRFAADRSIIGKPITLQGQQFTIVGVTAPEFVGTTPDVPSFWAPLSTRDLLIQQGGWGYRDWSTDRNTKVFTLLARLKPGVQAKTAESELRLIAARLAETYPDDERTINLKLERAGTFVALGQDVTQLLLPLLLGFGLVLIIACANVANLLLARSAGRHREIAVRLAVGAGRRHIVQQLIIESLLLAVAGGVAGLLFAIWTLSALYPIVLSAVPLPEGLATGFSLNLSPDWRVFTFTFLLAAAAGIGAGLIPALKVSKPELSGALKDEGSAFGQNLSHSRVRSVFLVLQIAVCMSLLFVAGLLVRNLQRVRTIDTGMSTKNVFSIAVGVSPPAIEKADSGHLGELRRELADRLRSTSGVASVSEAHRQPLSGEMGNTLVMLPGQSADHPSEVRFNFVSSEYFDALNVSLLRGRHFSEAELTARAPLLVISEATATRLWPGLNPLGQHLGVAASEQQVAATNDPAPITYKQYEVIGVARDARSRWVWEKDESFLYLPLSPRSPSGQYLIVRTHGDPGGVMQAVHGLAAAIDPSLRTSSRRLDEGLAFQMAPFRAIAWLSGVLGALALLLASIGLYGVMSFFVTQRTREIGIRVALGAQPNAIVRMFLWQGFRLTVLGIISGAIGGAILAQLLSSVLIDVSSLDLLVFGTVSTFLALVAMFAILLPARRATKVDPLQALRYE